MTETYLIYTIKYADNTKKNLIDLGWIPNEDLVYEGFFERFNDYEIREKHIGYEWSIIFREYLNLHSAFLIFKCLDNTCKIETFKDCDGILPTLLMQYGPSGMNGATGTQILRFFDRNEDLSNSKEGCILHHIDSKGNGLYSNDEVCYNFKINLHPSVTKKVKINIITLFTLFQIASYYKLRISSCEKFSDKHQRDVINEFQDYRFLLHNCPASKLFRNIFKDKISIIDEILDYRYMYLMNEQTRLVGKQNELVDRQIDVLNKIHKVEKGILILTVFVIFDVVYNLASEFIALFLEENYDFAIKTISLILALSSSLFAYERIEKLDSPQPREDDDWSPGYIDRMYKMIEDSLKGY